MLTWNELLIVYTYGIPIIILNMRIIYLLWRRRKNEFKSSYYRIFLVCSINDLLLYFSNNYVIRLPSVSILYQIFYSKFDEFSRWQTFPMFIVLYCSYFTHFGMFILSFNRLTAIWKFSSYEMLWKRITPRMLGFAMCGSFLFSFQGLFDRSRYVQIELHNETFVVLEYEEPFSLWNKEFVSVLTIAMFTVLNLVLNLSALILWHRRSSSSIPRKHYDYQWRLLFMTGTIYVLHLISFLYNSFRTVIFTDLIQRYIVYGFVSDFVALTPTITILIASTSMRRLVFGQSNGKSGSNQLILAVNE